LPAANVGEEDDEDENDEEDEDRADPHLRKSLVLRALELDFGPQM